VDEAEASYVAAGGHLSPVAHFGSDPLADSPELIQKCHRAMQQSIPTPEELFAFTDNGDYALLQVPAVHDPYHCAITKIGLVTHQYYYR